MINLSKTGNLPISANWTLSTSYWVVIKIRKWFPPLVSYRPAESIVAADGDLTEEPYRARGDLFCLPA